MLNSLIIYTHPSSFELYSSATIMPNSNHHQDFTQVENNIVLQSRYGLLHYAYLTRRTSHFLYAYHIRRSPYARFVRTTSFPYLYHPLSVTLVLHMIPSLLRIR